MVNFARPRILVSLLVGLAIAVILMANMHFLIVAESSRPRCVAHVKPGDRTAQTGAYSAARSSC